MEILTFRFHFVAADRLVQLKLECLTVQSSKHLRTRDSSHPIKFKKTWLIVVKTIDIIKAVIKSTKEYIYTLISTGDQIIHA